MFGEKTWKPSVICHQDQDDREALGGIWSLGYTTFLPSYLQEAFTFSQTGMHLNGNRGGSGERLFRRGSKNKITLYMLHCLLVGRHSESPLLCLSPVLTLTRSLISPTSSLGLRLGLSVLYHWICCQACDVGVHTAGCAFVHFSLITILNSISALMPGEASVLSESRRESLRACL